MKFSQYPIRIQRMVNKYAPPGNIHIDDRTLLAKAILRYGKDMKKKGTLEASHTLIHGADGDL